MKRFAAIIIGMGVMAVLCAFPLLADETRTCRSCGEAITGSYFETHGNSYHLQCFRCNYCNQAITESYVVQGNKQYHDFCFKRHVAVTCTVCGGVIAGEYIIDYWGNACHSQHDGKVSRCDFCKRFIAGSLVRGMARLPDGRSLCSLCAPSAVTGLEDARALMAEAAKRLAKFGLAVETSGIDIELAGIKKLRAVAKSGGHDLTGFVDYEVEKNAFGKVMQQKVKVYILHGMPRIQAAGAIAHELTHVWQFRQGRLHADMALSEGSANYAAYLVVRKMGGPEAQFIIDTMLKDEDPDYGEGFRRIKSYAEREGIAAWLKLLSSPEPMKSSF